MSDLVCQKLDTIISRLINLFFPGEVDIILRKKSAFRDPLQFSDREIQCLARLTKKQLIDFAMSSKGATLKKGELSLLR